MVSPPVSSEQERLLGSMFRSITVILKIRLCKTRHETFACLGLVHHGATAVTRQHTSYLQTDSFTFCLQAHPLSAHSLEWWKQCLGLLMHEGFLEYKVAFATTPALPQADVMDEQTLPHASNTSADSGARGTPDMHMPPALPRVPSASLASRTDPTQWDFRDWSQDGMGEWQQGVSPVDSGPSQEALDTFKIVSSCAERAQVDNVSKRRPRGNHLAPEDRAPFVFSTCDVVVTAKGQQFLHNGERLELLLPRLVLHVAPCFWD